MTSVVGGKNLNLLNGPALRGAIDLGALAAARESSRQAEERRRQQADGLAPVTVVDVTTANFPAEVLERSLEVPVVVDLWATWCEPCKQLSPVLEKLADEAAGSWLLAKIDVDAEPELAAVFRAQSVPSVIAVLNGQPVPLFAGAIPEQQIRLYLEELLKLAAENGVTGNLVPTVAEPADAAGRYRDPNQARALAALEAGDWEGAAAAFRTALEVDPADERATAGLAQVELMRRVSGVDPQIVIAAANNDSADVELALAAADIELLSGYPDLAFNRLITQISRASGDGRDQLRQRLLELFKVVGPDDPEVGRARIALANALF